jgi:hypothetical protein
MRQTTDDPIAEAECWARRRPSHSPRPRHHRGTAPEAVPIPLPVKPHIPDLRWLPDGPAPTTGQQDATSGTGSS